MSGLAGRAAIVGMVELAPERKPALPLRFTLEQWALLAKAALDDAGLSADVVSGIVTGRLAETELFAPATLSEYLGLPVNFAETVDLGGASSAAMVWRAAAAIELGICDAVLAVVPGTFVRPQSTRRPAPGLSPYGASSNLFGSPQAEFEIPYGHLGQNALYAQLARRYAEEFGYDARAVAKVAADQRTNAGATPDAIFHGQPITVDDVLASPMIADPLHKLEIVMPCSGGAAVLIANEDVGRRGRHRPVRITGFGERVTFKSPAFAPDMVRTPIADAAVRAFAMAGRTPDDINMASLYDCYTITVVMTLEDAGFCQKGDGMKFVAAHDLTYRGDFPVNTAGGQLSFGQAGMAGGMHHVCDAVRQLTGRAGAAQVPDCNIAFVSGNGGIMSEQVALVLEGG